jgi:Family of unknown function (DUF6226)
MSEPTISFIPAPETDPEAYSRVTNPERFLSLHTFALGLLDRLTLEYDVIRTEAFTLTPNMTPFEQPHPPVTLTPNASQAAPIAIAFTTFPSLVVHYGKWLAEGFPACGCDACAATAEREEERLEVLVGDVVAGRFREELRMPLFGRPAIHWSFGEIARAGHLSEGREYMSRDDARILHTGGPRRMLWRPWPRRGPSPLSTPAV